MGFFADRVKDTSTTTGTGNLTLAGSPPTGFQSFDTAFGHAAGNNFYYAIEGGSEWEVGQGHLSASTTLVRDQVFASSNSNALVSFSAGTKNVFNTIPAKYAQSVTVVLSDAAKILTDASLSERFRVTLGGNRLLGNPTNPTDGQIITWEIIQDATGSRILTVDSQFRFSTSVANATLSTVAGTVDFLTAQYNATAGTWNIIAFVKGYVPAPFVRAIGTMAAGTGSINPALPTGWQENDIFVLFCEAGGSEQASVPSGWTDMSVPGGNGASNLSVFWKRATSSESAPTVADSGAHTMGQIMAVAGCVASGNPWDVNQSSNAVGGGGTTSLSITGVTTTVINTLLVYACSCNSGTHSAGYSAWANASLLSITEQIDGFDATVGGHIGVATGIKVAAGASGTATVTFINTSSFGCQFSGALKAA